ncbi:MAG: pyrroline-5-carboxylate reductase [Thermodesulfobacteriota bacterium]
MLGEKKIGFIGSGNMGTALIRGLITSGTSSADRIICSDIKEAKTSALHEEFAVKTTSDNCLVATEADIVIYAIKPQIMARILKETAPCLDMTKVVVSIAAGVPLAAINSCLKKDLRLIRVMPNVGSAVMESATGITAGDHALNGDLDLVRGIFESIGKTVTVDEYLMDAITGLSGSGPAYIFMIVDAMADAGVKVGLSREDSLYLSAQTLLGAAKLLIETQEHPSRLKDSVTSPGGTAIAGLHTLEEGGLRTTLINAVESATKRAKELGEAMIKNFSNG